ncbi:MAG: glycosyltransferase family 4 protein, partial [Saprospiraceae bacterium]
VTKQLILSNQQKKGLKKRQIPIVVTVHDEYSVPFPTNLKHRIKQQFYRFEDIIDHFIIPAKHYYQLLAKNKRANIHYIPHFINLENWRYHPAINTKKQLLFVGRLEQEKGIFLLLNTLAALVKEDADYQLTIVGEGKEKQKIHQQIKSLGIANNVRVVGFKTAKALSNYYQQATLLIVPSLKKELFGLVGIEAQASGLPVIASDLAGMQEWCIHQQTGMTFKAKNAKQLQQQIQNLIADTILQEKLIKNAYQFVINNFSEEKAMTQLLDLYKTILHEV